MTVLDCEILSKFLIRFNRRRETKRGREREGERSSLKNVETCIVIIGSGKGC